MEIKSVNLFARLVSQNIVSLFNSACHFILIPSEIIGGVIVSNAFSGQKTMIGNVRYLLLFLPPIP